MRHDSLDRNESVVDNVELYLPAHSSTVRKATPSRRELRQSCLERDKRKSPDVLPEREPDISRYNVLT